MWTYIPRIYPTIELIDTDPFSCVPPVQAGFPHNLCFLEVIIPCAEEPTVRTMRGMSVNSGAMRKGGTSVRECSVICSYRIAVLNKTVLDELLPELLEDSIVFDVLGRHGLWCVM